jgi:hypothetical protein
MCGSHVYTVKDCHAVVQDSCCVDIVECRADKGSVLIVAAHVLTGKMIKRPLLPDSINTLFVPKSTSRMENRR